MPSWPSDLQQLPLADGYKEKLADNALRLAFDQGNPHARQRSNLNDRTINLSVLVSKAQLDIFRAFYETTLKSGSLFFDWAVTGGDVYNLEFVEPPGMSSVSYNRYKINMTLKRTR